MAVPPSLQVAVSTTCSPPGAASHDCTHLSYVFLVENIVTVICFEGTLSGNLGGSRNLAKESPYLYVPKRLLGPL